MKQLINVKKHNMNSTKEDIIEKLKKSEEEIKRGEGREADVVFKELRKKYEY